MYRSALVPGWLVCVQYAMPLVVITHEYIAQCRELGLLCFVPLAQKAVYPTVPILSVTL